MCWLFNRNVALLKKNLRLKLIIIKQQHFITTKTVEHCLQLLKNLLLLHCCLKLCLVGKCQFYKIENTQFVSQLRQLRTEKKMRIQKKVCIFTGKVKNVALKFIQINFCKSIQVNLKTSKTVYFCKIWSL